MNCKKGDLAITRIPTDLDGKFVNVLRAAVPMERVGIHYWPGPIDSFGHAWVVEFHCPDPRLGRVLLFYDKFLRPIRYGEGRDEMLRIVGKQRELVSS